MKHRDLISNTNPEESMNGFFYFMLAVPIICLTGIAFAIHYASKIDNIPNWLILTFVMVICVVFGILRLIKLVRQ